MQVNIKSNVKEFKKGLTNVQKKQIPFATSRALNKTGVLVLVGLGRSAQKTFEGGATPSTMRAFATPKGLKGTRHNIRFSTKRDLTTAIFLPAWASNYLKYQIDGGVRQTQGKGTGVPTRNKKLNKFGNISGRKSGLIKGKKQFVAKIKDIEGVWERYGKGGRDVRLLIAFEKNPSYRKKFTYYGTATKLASLHFKRKMKLELANALRTAK
tara:strand:- start:42 stop:674 length:633 start_codon:yes stop_codon:yes gene_type:complete